MLRAFWETDLNSREEGKEEEPEKGEKEKKDRKDPIKELIDFELAQRKKEGE